MARQRAEVLHPPGLPEKRVIDGIVEGLAPTDNLARLAQTEGIALVVTASGEVSEVRQSAVLPKPASDRGTMTPVARADDLARVVDCSRALAWCRGPHARVRETEGSRARPHHPARVVDILSGTEAATERPEVRHHAGLPEEGVPLCGPRNIDLARADDLACVVDRRCGTTGSARQRAEVDDHEL